MIILTKNDISKRKNEMGEQKGKGFFFLVLWGLQTGAYSFDIGLKCLIPFESMQWRMWKAQIWWQVASFGVLRQFYWLSPRLFSWVSLKK